MIIVRLFIILIISCSLSFAGSKKDCCDKIDNKIKHDDHWTRTEYHIKGDRVSRGAVGKIEYTRATDELDGYVCDRYGNVKRVHGSWYGMGRMRVFDDKGHEYVMDVDEDDDWEDD